MGFFSVFFFTPPRRRRRRRWRWRRRRRWKRWRGRVGELSDLPYSISKLLTICGLGLFYSWQVMNPLKDWIIGRIFIQADWVLKMTCSYRCDLGQQAVWGLQNYLVCPCQGNHRWDLKFNKSRSFLHSKINVFLCFAKEKQLQPPH